MYDRENERRARRLKEKRMREKRRRRRRRRIVRALLLLLMTFLLLLAGLGLFFLGKTLFKDRVKEKLRLQWDIGKADVVLDAGHGGKDQGASSGEAIEKDITLEIAKKTKKLLEEAGCKVGMVRNDDTFVELGERAEYGNRKEAKVFVSIHCNSAEGEANGIETFYTEQKGEESQKLAQLLQKNVIAQTQARDREVKAEDYTVIVRTDMPAALVEVGFLSDPEECKLLRQEDYQRKLAEGIAAGILAYLKPVT